MHEQGCKCSECCYPQRSKPPVSEVKTAEVMKNKAVECAKKQVGDAGWN